MKDHVSADDHWETLAWLDESLEWARPRARTKLLRMLDLVRTETVSDMAFSESPPSVRNEAAAVGLKLHENRRV